MQSIVESVTPSVVVSYDSDSVVPVSFSVLVSSVVSGMIVVSSSGVCVVVTGAAVVVGIGQSSPSAFVFSVNLSGQHPNKEPKHSGGGHLLFFLSVAGVSLSGQQPNFVSLHVFGVGHPSSKGPVAAVLLSTAQHPNSVKMQGNDAGFTRHFRGFCSNCNIVDMVFGVVDSASSMSVSSVVEIVLSPVDSSLVCDTLLSSVDCSVVGEVLVLEISVALLSSVDWSVVDRSVLVKVLVVIKSSAESVELSVLEIVVSDESDELVVLSTSV